MFAAMAYKHNCKVISLQIYPFDILVSIGESDECFLAGLKHHASAEIINEIFPEDGLLSFTPTGQGRTAHFKISKVTIIRMKQPIKTPFAHAILAHEIFHAVDMIFRTIGMNLSKDSDEAYAYAIQYLTEQIYTQFKIK